MKFFASTCVVVLSLALLGAAEPPVNRYLPPGQGQGHGQNQGYRTTNQDSFAPPSQSYGAPSAPSSQYGAPSAPSSQYGAPGGQGNGGHGGQTQAVFRPQQNYGAPKPSQNYGAPSNQYLPANQGYSNGNGNGNHGEEYNEPANYNFEYMVKDEHSGNDFGHKESRQGDRAEGEYYVLLPDGRKQIVRYEADEQGYRPKISYEDVGSGNGGYGRGGPSGGGYSSGPQGPY